MSKRKPKPRRTKRRRQRSLGGTPEEHAAIEQHAMAMAIRQAEHSYMSAGGAYDCQDALESLGRAAFSLGLAGANSVLKQSTPASQAIDKAFSTVIKYCVRK